MNTLNITHQEEERETPHIETDIGIAVWLKIFLDVFAGGGMAKV